MNTKSTLTINTYTSENFSEISFELHDKTISEEIIKTIKFPEIIKELKEIIRSEDKPYPMDYMIDIFYTHTNPHIVHRHFEKYWHYIKTVNSEYDAENKIYHYNSSDIFSRPVILYPTDNIVINDNDVRIICHNHSEIITDELTDNVIRPEITKELRLRRQYQENQNLEYIADVFLDDNQNDIIPVRKVMNDYYKAKNSGWIDSTSVTIKKADGNFDIKVFVHERVREQH